MPFKRNPNLSEEERKRNRLKARCRSERLREQRFREIRKEYGRKLKGALKQKNLTRNEKLAYLAGLLEGDGTISIYYHTGKSVYYPRVSFTNTERKLVQAFFDFFGNGTAGERYNKTSLGGKLQYWWQCSHQSIVFDRLTMLLPFLRGKRRDQAILVLEWIMSRKLTPKGRGYTDEQLKMVEEVRALHR